MKKFLVLVLSPWLLQCGGSSSGGKVKTPVAAAGPESSSRATSLGDDASLAAGDRDRPATGSDTSQGRAQVQVHFQPQVDTDDLVCFDKSDALLEQGQVFTDVRIFLSNLSLIRDDGQEFKVALDVAGNSSNLQYVDKDGNSIALLNFLDPACSGSDATKVLKSEISGSIPSGTYRAIRFQLGLPYLPMAPALAQVPASLAPSDMGWMWQHYPADFQIEINTGRSNGGKNKLLSTLISSSKPIITLPLEKNVLSGEVERINLRMDFAKLFKTSAREFVRNLEASCNGSGSPMTEDSAYCAHAFKALGLPVDNPKAPYTQSIFTLQKD